MNGIFSMLGAVLIGVIVIKAFAIGAIGIDLKLLSQILDRGVTGVTTFGSGVDLCDSGACIEPEFRSLPQPQVSPASDRRDEPI
jgi:hypothetical protein